MSNLPPSTSERQRQILELPLSQPELRVNQLSKLFGIREITVQRNLEMLGGKQVNAVPTGLDSAYAMAALKVLRILSGDSFHFPARSYVGALATNMLSRLQLDKGFFSCKCITPTAGFTDVVVAEEESKESLINSTHQVIGLVDLSKFGQEALCQVIPLERCHTLITDRELGPTHR